MKSILTFLSDLFHVHSWKTIHRCTLQMTGVGLWVKGQVHDEALVIQECSKCGCRCAYRVGTDGKAVDMDMDYVRMMFAEAGKEMP